MASDSVLRDQLLALLKGGNAHMEFDEAVADFPDEAMNQIPPNVSYTPWHLLEHIRRTQNDILEFVRDPAYVSPPWPVGYWPKPGEKATRERWDQTVADFHSDLKAFEAILEDPKVNITAELPHAPGYTLLREALLIADHNAYHLGEFAILRQVMGTWPKDRKS
jgi:hypothetical protein